MQLVSLTQAIKVLKTSRGTLLATLKKADMEPIKGGKRQFLSDEQLSKIRPLLKASAASETTQNSVLQTIIKHQLEIKASIDKLEGQVKELEGQQSKSLTSFKNTLNAFKDSLPKASPTLAQKFPK